jgi:DNA-binding NarL/FixJ family response regulator
MAKILIADDHPFTLMGTKAYIQGLGHFVCELCSNGISAYNMILQKEPDIALLDINMPGMNGIEIAEKLQTAQPKTKIILLTMHKERSIFQRAQTLGVKGYVLKEFATDVLDECITAVLQGKMWTSPELNSHLQMSSDESNPNSLQQLTFAERKIISLIGQQYSSKKIAELLFISEKTVENHRSNIIKKLDLPSERNALLVWALAHQKDTV